ncbi:hypothetical protein HDV04_000831 [Boothiomyces sp. JEL0838]|nr:hypothetical protein HDV04_001823 [Boothiomyces sp. JEL0838]KAJ3308735.1 hypothetical protein HDV04_000831 [Boothiomyces sp. JEL0838]
MSHLKGYFKRTLEYMKSQTKNALNVKPPEYKEELLFKFNTVESMEKWIVGSDADIGGYTEAFWGLTPQKTALFWGNLSTRIPPGSPLEYSGYAGIRSLEKEPVMFHTPRIDSSLYRFMEIRAKGDKKQWMQVQMDRANIKTIGFSIVKQPGEFSLEIDYIKQINLENTLGDMDLVPTVSRILASSETIISELTLDVNTEIYPLKTGDKFSLLLVHSLDGSVVDVTKKETWKPTKKSLADDYDYVMYGKVYKYDDENNSKV